MRGKIQVLIEDYGYRVRGLCGDSSTVKSLFDKATEQLCRDIHITLDAEAQGYDLNIGYLAAACMYHKGEKP